MIYCARLSPNILIETTKIALYLFSQNLISENNLQDLFCSGLPNPVTVLVKSGKKNAEQAIALCQQLPYCILLALVRDLKKYVCLDSLDIRAKVRTMLTTKLVEYIDEQSQRDPNSYHSTHGKLNRMLGTYSAGEKLNAAKAVLKSIRPIHR